ncbi:helix-turn-helix transcriptional regulator [Treponema sp. UBA3813]|uniref:helix-turn-helix domain-containing protein n=1 Tax=Treponema sp. UBA3813 TaxID=1947715 RepID=UPI0025DF9A9E|nr:helix-turn-helix transcriptional regulator [Treponema sp. UBA3813]
MDFRERLREEIAFSGLSYKELSSQTGISHRTIISYVSGQACMPSADAAVKLAKVLNTSVEYLIMGDKNSFPHEDDKESRELLHIFKKLPAAQKKLLLAIAEDIGKMS